ncbi:MAG: hypothetical protein QOE51_2130 [Actinoplanes sp.]|nr:hypothetical protein [Actinoplanes sp.]
MTDRPASDDQPTSDGRLESAYRPAEEQPTG